MGNDKEGKKKGDELGEREVRLTRILSDKKQ